jgi:hypothetical protein
MIRIPKSVVSFGALALAAGALTLAVPRAAHAVAAALVQVSNPPASPANTEDTSRQANQLVQLNCGVGADLTNCILLGSNQPVYTVPNNQSLVITSVELTAGVFNANSSISVTLNDLNLAGNPPYHFWVVAPSLNTVQFQYPSGIVLPPGTEVGIFYSSRVAVQLSGYLTTN